MGLPTDDRDAEIARLRAAVAELLGVVADLRQRIEAQQAHIHPCRRCDDTHCRPTRTR